MGLDPIASQLSVTDWRAVIGDPNQADAICDRLLHDAQGIELKARSMATDTPRPKTPTPEPTRASCRRPVRGSRRGMETLAN